MICFSVHVYYLLSVYLTKKQMYVSVQYKDYEKTIPGTMLSYTLHTSHSSFNYHYTCWAWHDMMIKMCIEI